MGVNFEAGNETREKISSDFVAEQNEEWSEKKVVLFSFNYSLVLLVVWRFLEIYNNFILIRWFFMYFADFWANFCNLFTFVLFYCLKWGFKTPLLLAQFLVNKYLQFYGYEAIFCWEIWRKMAKIGTIFLNFFLQFFVFLLFFR